MPAVGPVTYETYTRRDNRTMDKQCSDMILTTGGLIVAGLSFVLLYLASKRQAMLKSRQKENAEAHNNRNSSTHHGEQR